jgi:hypothetical protein
MTGTYRSSQLPQEIAVEDGFRLIQRSPFMQRLPVRHLFEGKGLYQEMVPMRCVIPGRTELILSLITVRSDLNHEILFL